jgi:hypothetical protein
MATNNSFLPIITNELFVIFVDSPHLQKFKIAGKLYIISFKIQQKRIMIRPVFHKSSACYSGTKINPRLITNNSIKSPFSVSSARPSVVPCDESSSSGEMQKIKVIYLVMKGLRCKEHIHHRLGIRFLLSLKEKILKSSLCSHCYQKPDLSLKILVFATLRSFNDSNP